MAKRKKHEMRIEKRTQEISPQETIDKCVNYIHWIKYAYPRDENERWFNRGCERAMEAIKDIETFE